ncbi:MAG: tRNA glutamyl-Q(34) synthetase GluQRS [Planctomycetota bacterium]
MSSSPPPPVGRLAPSPTGLLHLGHARSFLLAWWHSRARGGRILLRIEDLDAGRVRPGLTRELLADLAWLGLDWDGEPLVQSRDTAALRAAADELLLRGLAYPCTCSRRDVELAASAPHPEDGETRYPGTCRGRYASVAAAERESGRPAGVRFRVPDGKVLWRDELRGLSRHDPAREVGDFLVARRDGAYAYQLAVVVDDARQGVTEVLRGDDLAPSTARQLLLQRALGLPHPRWLHVPLVVDEDGRRLAKRHGDVALASLRAEGTDPRAVVAWAARTAGQSAPDRLTPAELLPRFDLARLPLSPVPLAAATLAQLRAARP